MATGHERFALTFPAVSRLVFRVDSLPYLLFELIKPLLIVSRNPLFLSTTASSVKIYGAPPSRHSFDFIAQQEICVGDQPCFSINVRTRYLLADSRPNDPVLIWEGPLPSRPWFGTTNTILLRMTERDYQGDPNHLHMTVDSVVVSGLIYPPPKRTWVALIRFKRL